jgi:hypothetical protein
MKGIVTWLRRLGRRLEPPGNRGPLDESYRQPNGGDGGNVAPFLGGPDMSTKEKHERV